MSDTLRQFLPKGVAFLLVQVTVPDGDIFVSTKWTTVPSFNGMSREDADPAFDGSCDCPRANDVKRLQSPVGIPHFLVKRDL